MRMSETSATWESPSQSTAPMSKKPRMDFGPDWEHLGDHVCVHTNDTHPAMCGPELMRLLVDDKGVDFDLAFEIAKKTVSFTNHTVMPEALEKWPINTFRALLPRLYMFIEEIDRRYRDGLSEKLSPEDGSWTDVLRNTAILRRLAGLVVRRHEGQAGGTGHGDVDARQALVEVELEGGDHAEGGRKVLEPLGERQARRPLAALLAGGEGPALRRRQGREARQVAEEGLDASLVVRRVRAGALGEVRGQVEGTLQGDEAVIAVLGELVHVA